MIDRKLNNINIDIKYPNIENFTSEKNIEILNETNDNKNSNIDNNNNSNIDNNKNSNIDNNNNSNIDNNIDNDKNNKTIYNKDKIKKSNTKKQPVKFNTDLENIDGFSNDVKNTYKDWNIETKKTQVCCKNHIHIKNGKNTKCTYGVTNYADPKDMSPIDLRIFYLNYPPNMTLQDYINWLYCYIDIEDQLPYNHLKNLEKLKLGKELVTEEGILPPPGYYFPSMDAKDYFDKMYNDKQEFNIAAPLNSTTGPMIGYNYKDYSEFITDMNMNGVSGEIRNPDIPLKKNAKQLYNYINPRDSNSINIDNEYQIYRMKNVEI